MKYRDILGYSKSKKKNIKEKSKPKKTVLDGIKQELNEWNESIPSVKRWSKKLDSNGLTEHEQMLKEVGNASVHKKMIQNIDNGLGYYKSSVDNYVDFLNKQGHKKEAKELQNTFIKGVGQFRKFMKVKFLRMIDKLI